MLMIDSLFAEESGEPVEFASKTTVTLTLEQRAKTRLRVHLDDGRDAGIRLPRDDRMKPGTLLLAESGERVEVLAANEPVSVATTPDRLLFARACYHLGNRHVALQIEDDWLAYQPDHVLDGMLEAVTVIITAMIIITTRTKINWRCALTKFPEVIAAITAMQLEFPHRQLQLLAGSGVGGARRLGQ